MHQRIGSAARLVVVLVPLLASLQASAQSGIVYKCTQPDGRTEYSNVPCGPDEEVDFITGESFSVVGRRGSERAIPPPLSPRATQRQRFMAREAEQSGGR
jgi:hypothetical protein